MAQEEQTPSHAEVSTGHQLAEADYLDSHFEAFRPEYEYMLKSVGISSGSTILDAGVGGGSFLPLIAEAVGTKGSIHALDLASENVDRVMARADRGDFSCPVDIRQGSIVKLPYESDSFDVIWCANVIQYLTDVEFELALHEFARVLRSGGILAIKEIDVTTLYFGPISPFLWWHLIESIFEPGNSGISAVLGTIDFPGRLTDFGFENVRYETVVAERRHPLTGAELDYFRSIIPFWYTMAQEAGVSEAEQEIWRTSAGELEHPNHILKNKDFYFREVHGVVLGTVP